jgi:hypothetical protein
MLRSIERLFWQGHLSQAVEAWAKLDASAAKTQAKVLKSQVPSAIGACVFR